MAATFEHQLKCRSSFLSKRSCKAGADGDDRRFFIPEAKSQFSPDRLIDVDHIKLDISVDLESRALSGACTTEFHAVAPAVGRLIFDAIDLKVTQVLDGQNSELQFHQTDKKIIIYLKKVLQPGEKNQVVLKYSVTEPRAGLHFVEQRDGSKIIRQLWTQGQDQDNRFWIPCHDAPNEKATSEMVVTVDEKLTAISNGKLLNVKHDQEKKKKTYHWKQAIPHASYLITLCVGEFTEIKEAWKNARGEEIPVLFYTPPGREKETKFAFSKTTKMLDFFSKKIGVEYPYEKYAQVIALDFIYGGMENTSATTQTEYTLHPESIDLDYSSEPLVAHELAHQWFGDLLTCKEWAHAWLNEGFATYFESIWTEQEKGKEEFLYELYEYEGMYKDEASSHYSRPLVTPTFLSPSDIFDRHLYEKGARVLHMLRKLVGEELWWKAINLYVTNHYAKTVETVDLQRAFEETSGRALTWFFDQWVYRSNHPKIKGSYEWVDDKKLAKISLTQQQAKDQERDLLYNLPLQIKIALPGGDIIHEVLFDRGEQTFWFSCTEKPLFVSVNSENTILAEWEFDPGRDALIQQLKTDKDVMGRVFAANALSKDHYRACVEALGQALKSEKFWGVQAEICLALADIGSPLAQKYLLDNGLELRHPKARKSAVKALARFQNDLSSQALERVLKSDTSPLVQFEAGLALGKIGTPGTFEKLAASLGKRESWHDYYDRGILQGLAELKFDDKVFSILSQYTDSKFSMFTRREAVDALSKYGSARPAVVVDKILDLTRERNFFVRLNAINAVADLGLSRGVGELDHIAASVVEPRTRRAAIVGAKILRKGSTEHESLEKLRTDFDKLKMQYTSVLGRLEKLEEDVVEKSN